MSMLRSRTAILGLILAAAVVAFFLLMVGKWYGFATSSEITQNEGVYADKGLEIWIDINARMPKPMRLWGCKTLRDREAAKIGGNTLPPYSCQPDFGAYDSMSKGEALTMAYSNGVQATAKAKGATPGQLDQIKTCFSTDFKASLTPDQATALEGQLQKDMVIELSRITTKVASDCMAKAGL